MVKADAISYALRLVSEESRAVVEAALRTDGAQELHREHELSLETAGLDVIEKLADVYPPDVLLHRSMAVAAIPKDDLKFAGPDTLLWAAAKLGRGQSSNPTAFVKCLVALARWNNQRWLANMSNSTPQAVLGIDIIRQHELIRRAMPSTNDYRWVSRQIFDSAASVTQEDERFKNFAFLDQPMVDEVFTYNLKSAYPVESLERQEMAWHSLSPEAKKLCNLFATKREPGSLTTARLRQVMESTEAENYPFVQLGDAVVPMEPRKALLNLEVALFNAARTMLGDFYGDWFELVAAHAIHSVLPGTTLLTSGTAIRVSKKNAGQVDFAVTDKSNTAIISEVKGYATTPRIDAVQNSWSGVSGVQEQLRLRIDAHKNGSSLVDDKRKVAVDEVVGLGITQTSYAGALWSSPALHHLGALQSDIAVLPLAQAIPVIAALDGSQGVRKYVHNRQKFMSHNVVVSDEITILLHLATGALDKIPSDLEGKPGDSYVLPSFLELPIEKAIGPRPTKFGAPWLIQMKKDLTAHQ